MTGWPRDYLLAVLLAGVATLLALSLTLEWVFLGSQPIPDSESSPSPTASPEADAGTPGTGGFQLPGVDSYVQMTERPLFMETRQPGAENIETPAPPAPPVTEPPKLMGVIRVLGSTTVLMMDSKGKYRRLRDHDLPVDGWTVVDVKNDRVTMQSQVSGDTKEIPLLKPHSAPRPGVPARPGAPRQPVPAQPVGPQPTPSKPPLAGGRPPIPASVPSNAGGDQVPPGEDTNSEDGNADVETDIDENS